MNTSITKRALLVFSLLIVAVDVHAEWFRDTRSIMGTRIEVEIWSDDRDQAEKIISGVMKEMHRIDLRMSTHKNNSELSRINNNAVHEWVTTDGELFDLIRYSVEMSEQTRGAFDVTYASVGRYYDYRKKQKPDKETITRLLGNINYRNIELDSKKKQIRFSNKAVYIDLGGIAKGYAVDRSIEYLISNGVKHAIVTAGGDSRILGDRRGRPWYLGIRHPRSRSEVIARMPVINEAVSTSGDYERYFEQDGVRYHHILNPQTGDSARAVSSVTVIGKEAIRTDALSTGLFVMGIEKAMKMIESIKGYEAVIVDAKGKMFYSSGFGRASSVKNQ